MTKTIPVVSGREFWLSFDQDGCDVDDKPTGDVFEIHVATVTDSIQLDDLKDFVDEFCSLYDELVEHYNKEKCPQCKIHLKSANEALTTFRERYANLLKGEG